MDNEDLPRVLLLREAGGCGSSGSVARVGLEREYEEFRVIPHRLESPSPGEVPCWKLLRAVFGRSLGGEARRRLVSRAEGVAMLIHHVDGRDR
ncbi:TPA: hypothetical protein DCY65_05680 [Candidatus Acetothermia bacterium]|nr:hypothetical protein [Candidatus Acetothermia bacterium]